MPKSQATPKSRATEAYFARRHQALQDASDKHLQHVQENLVTLRAKNAELLKKKGQFIKHTQVRKLFIKLTKIADIEKTVQAIDSATKGNRGSQWEAQFIENVIAMTALMDDALTVLKKLISKKEDEEKKVMDIQRKAEEFHNSCLAKLQELKTEGQKPFQISSTNTPGSDYLYTSTPFQCYK